MSSKVKAILGYGMTFDYAKHIYTKINYDIDDNNKFKDQIKQTLIKKDFISYINEKSKEILNYENLEVKNYLYLIQNIPYEENKIEFLTNYICSRFVYTGKNNNMGLNYILLITMFENKYEYDNYIVTTMFKHIFKNQEPDILYINEPIFPTTNYILLKNNTYVSKENREMSINNGFTTPNDYIPGIPSNIVLLLYYLDFFEDKNWIYKLQPMIYFYYK